VCRDREVGENIEFGHPGLVAGEVLRDWLASPGHRANLVSARWRDAGIGAVFTGALPASTVVFRRRSSPSTWAGGGASAMRARKTPDKQVHPHPWVGKTEVHPPPGFDPIAETRMKKLQNGDKSANMSPGNRNRRPTPTVVEPWPSPERKK
jgi:hypothetical protein